MTRTTLTRANVEMERGDYLRRQPCECYGDESCPECDGDGWYFVRA